MDPKDLKILAALGIVVLVIFALVMTFGGSVMTTDDPGNPISPTPSKDPDVRYDMTVETCDHFYTSYDYRETPDEGRQYVIIHFRLVNDSYEPGLDLSPYFVEWTLTARGVIYSFDSDTYAHPERQDAEAMLPGGTIDDVRVFQIPEGIGLSEIKLSLEYDEFGKHPVLKRDDSLIPNA